MPATLQPHLPPGTKVSRYELGEVLGEGGFAITYRAWDSRLHRDVAIKEFLPQDLALREPGGAAVLARSGHEDEYRFGLQRFLDEAKTLAQFDHPNIVRVTDHFEANNTAYLVMFYERGRSLSQWLIEHPGPVPEATLRQWLAPFLRGLREVHDSGYLHRDIKPGNIYLRDKGEPLLIDFGSARQAMGRHSRSVTGVISAGYAPLEQYGRDARKQNARTDLYALGATLYRCISVADPVDALTHRNALDDSDPDPLIAAAEIGAGRYSAPLHPHLHRYCSRKRRALRYLLWRRHPRLRGSKRCNGSPFGRRFGAACPPRVLPGVSPTSPVSKPWLSKRRPVRIK